MTQDATPSRIPTLAVTLGDVAGIGPEITAKMLLGHDELRQRARLLVVGDAAVLAQAVQAVGAIRRGYASSRRRPRPPTSPAASK